MESSPLEDCKSTLGKGRIVRVSGWEELVESVKEFLTELNLPIYDLQPDNTFGTQIAEDRLLFLNRNTTDRQIEITCRAKQQVTILPAMTISNSQIVFPMD